MPKLSKENIVKVGTNEVKIGELIKTLVYLPAEQVVSYFQEIGLTIPRELRIYVLKETLRQRVADTRRTRGTLADELNYRLSWFAEFSETQLENLLVFFDDEQLIRQFLDDFWTDLIGYMVDKQVPANDLKKLVDQSIANAREKGLILPDIKKYNRTLSVLFYDSFNRIDGLSPQKIRPVLYKSSTLAEVRDLGAKYGVKVPRRLKKNELAEIIIHELKDKGEYTDSLAEQVKSMSVLVLQRFAIDHDIKASTELKKEEIIEFILKNAKETREAYFVPSSIAAYDQEIGEISDEIVEEPAPTPEPEVIEEPLSELEEEPFVEEEPEVEEEKEPEQIIEEKPEVKEEIETVPEKVVNQQPTQIIQQSVNLDALVAEVKALRETIAALAIKPEPEQKPHIIEEVKVEEPKVKEPVRDMYPEKGEPIVVNTAEFAGSSKNFKKIMKTEIKEREAFVEQQKLEEQGVVDDSPGELKAMKKVGIFLLKFLKVLMLKIVIPVVSIALLLLIIYGTIDFFTSVPFIDDLTDTINNAIQIRGIGLLDYWFNLLQYDFGLTPAA